MKEGGPPQINMSVPHETLMDRLRQIGYHDLASSPKALLDAQTIIMNLRLGKLMISRRAVDANGKEGLFTAFQKPTTK